LQAKSGCYLLVFVASWNPFSKLIPLSGRLVHTRIAFGLTFLFRRKNTFNWKMRIPLIVLSRIVHVSNTSTHFLLGTSDHRRMRRLIYGMLMRRYLADTPVGHKEQNIFHVLNVNE
jgi:hypothetical protein